jgi:hypothetical protein
MTGFLGLFKGLFCGSRPMFSMGRVAFWPLYGVALYHWITGRPVPGELYTMLMVVAGYVFGSKGINAVFGGRKTGGNGCQR